MMRAKWSEGVGKFFSRIVGLGFLNQQSRSLGHTCDQKDAPVNNMNYKHEELASSK